uniref:Uncharacterized protein n=1 Tax=Schizaphis graminum TaxID=13262 RepID=A0A2S2P8U8_SCHGA
MYSFITSHLVSHHFVMDCVIRIEDDLVNTIYLAPKMNKKIFVLLFIIMTLMTCECLKINKLQRENNKLREEARTLMDEIKKISFKLVQQEQETVITNVTIHEVNKLEMVYAGIKQSLNLLKNVFNKGPSNSNNINNNNGTVILQGNNNTVNNYPNCNHTLHSNNLP